MSQYKPNADLNFYQKYTNSNADLDFGQELGTDVTHVVAVIKLLSPVIAITVCYTDNTNVRAVVTLPKLQIAAKAVVIADITHVTAAVILPSLQMVTQVSYDANVWRGLAGIGKNNSETADRLLATIPVHSEKSALLQSSSHINQESAQFFSNAVSTYTQLTERIIATVRVAHELARYLDNCWQSGFENLTYVWAGLQSHTEFASYLAIYRQGGFEAMIKLQMPMVAGMETANRLTIGTFSKAEVSRWVRDGYRVGFEVARPVPYATNVLSNDKNNAKPQYKPSADLNFGCRWVAPNTNLAFYESKGGAKCQPQDKLLFQYDEVIFVSNSISLTNLDTGKEITIYSGNIGIDNKAYCWSLSAEIAYFETIEKGTLVELVINDEVWRFIIDEISEGRQFGETTINISGKSQALLLAYPFVNLRGYKYDQPTSAVQIAQAEINRVGGFSLDWRLIASNGWLIPANAYSYTQYTPIQVIQDIANAGGGFVNAHPSKKTLIIKSDYPVASWQWASLKPDIVIPDSLIWSKGDTYTQKSNYTGIWVSSDRDNGVQGFIRRKGYDGSLTPDQVIHSAITEQSVAIHRGICELSQAGMTQSISLNTPLHKDIGVLAPSDFVTVRVAGVGQNAIVRGVSINFSMSNDGKLDIQNQLKLEAKIGDL